MKKIITLTILSLILFFSNGDLSHSGERKDRVKAFFMSFILPGFGQYYADSPGNAKIFIATEFALWGGLYYNTLIKKAYRKDYLSHAALHAGVNPSGLGTSYINALGSYNSSFDYNQRQLQIKANPELYTGNLTWEWDTWQNRSRFSNLRERELDYDNYIKYCIAGIILNHFLSGLNASKLVQDINKTNSTLTVNVLENGIIANYFWGF